MQASNSIWNKNFILLLISNFMMCITYYAIISALPVYLVDEIQANKAQVGLVLAAYTLASVTVRPLSGYALDSFGRRIILLSSLILYSFFFLGYLLAFSITSLVVLRFFQGISWGITTISSSTIAVDIIPAAKRGEGIGYFALSTTLGMSVGPVIGLFVLHNFGYTIMFLFIFLASFISLLSAYKLQLPRRLLVKRNLPFELKNIFHRNSILPSLNVLILMTSYGGLLSFIALYGKENEIHNPSLFFLIFAVGIASSRVFLGKTFDKNGPGKILTTCLSLLIVGFPILAIWKNEVGYYLSAIVIGFGIGVVFPTFQAIINNLSGSTNRGAANSTLYTALDFGMGIGMLLSGLVAQHISISAVFIGNAFISLLGLVIFKSRVLPFYEKNRL